MSKPLKIILICLCLVAISFGTVIGVSYLPHHIHQEFAGIELLIMGEDDYEVLQPLSIRIDGRVRYGIFDLHPWFDGFIEVNAYDFTLDNSNITIPFIHGFSMGGPMSYPVLTPTGGSTRIETLGMIYTDEDFSSLAIMITEWIALGGGSYQGQSGNRVIAAPATDSSEALNVLRLHNVFWLDEFGVVHRQ